MNGTIQKSPGPRRPAYRPSRRTIARSHCWAIRGDWARIMPSTAPTITPQASCRRYDTPPARQAAGQQQEHRDDVRPAELGQVEIHVSFLGLEGWHGCLSLRATARRSDSIASRAEKPRSLASARNRSPSAVRCRARSSSFASCRLAGTPRTCPPRAGSPARRPAPARRRPSRPCWR